MQAKASADHGAPYATRMFVRESSRSNDQAAEAGMAKMSERYRQGGDLYMPANAVDIGTVTPWSGSGKKHEQKGFSPLLRPRAAAVAASGGSSQEK